MLNFRHNPEISDLSTAVAENKDIWSAPDRLVLIWSASVYAAPHLVFESRHDATVLSVDEAEGDRCEDAGGEKNLHPWAEIKFCYLLSSCQICFRSQSSKFEFN